MQVDRHGQLLDRHQRRSAGEHRVAPAGRFGRGLDPEAGQARHLGCGVVLRQLLTHERIRGDALAPGDREQQIETASAAPESIGIAVLGRQQGGDARIEIVLADVELAPAAPHGRAATAAETVALVGERRERHAPPVVDLAEEVRVVDDGIFEEHLVEQCAARDLAQRTHVDTGLMHVDDEICQATMLRHVGVGAGDQDAVASPVCARGPHLLPVDDPVITVADRLRAQRRQIGTSAGLAEQLTPDVLPAQDARQVPVDLIVGAMGEQRRPGEHRGDSGWAAERPDLAASAVDL